MAICEWCGEEFDLDEAEDEFEDETWLLSYRNVQKCLCGSCAVKAVDDLIDGVYFETCEKCGKTFDLALDCCDFDSCFSVDSGAGLRDYWQEQILCCDCALDVASNDEEALDDD